MGWAFLVSVCLYRHKTLLENILKFRLLQNFGPFSHSDFVSVVCVQLEFDFVKKHLSARR